MKTHLAMRWLMLVSMFIYSLGPVPLWANPTGGQVVAGSATISTNGNTLNVNQSTSRAIINWQSFSIAGNELTYIAQPNSASAELDRVVGGSASSLLGSLESNGQVYLINPSGIVFGQGFTLNTAGFLASTLDVNNSDFMAGGKIEFTGSSTAGITNNGSLTTTDGDVFLFARTVTNNGTINASGTAGLAAGSDILLAPAGNQRVFIQAGSQPGSVVNTGTVQAIAAELKAVGGNAGALAINNTGTIRATGVANVGGHIYLTAVNGDISNSGSLVAQDAQGNGGTIQVQATSTTPTVTPATVYNSGTIDASGTATASSTGGTVIVTGNQVGLMAGSVINVSGNAGGGTALIGGGEHGADASVLDAQATYVDPQAQIIANALLTGNGGNVVVWSNNYTGFYGSISATGGSISGNGGEVETSSANNLQAFGSVDVSAPNGSGGDWLLDPYNVTISSAATSNGSFTANVFAPTGAGAVASSLDIEDALNEGDNVTITTSDASGNQLGNITVEGTSDANPVDIDSTSTRAVTLTLEAANNITIDSGAVIESTGDPLNIVLDAGINTDGVTPVATGAGSIIIHGATLETNGGNLTLGGGLTPLSAPAIGSGTNGDAVNGVFIGNGSDLNAGGGSISILGESTSSVEDTADGVDIDDSSLTTTGTGTITITGTSLAAGNGLSDSSGSSNDVGVLLNNGAALSSGGAITITGTGSTAATGSNNPGVRINNGSSIASSLATGTAINITGTSGAGNSHGINMLDTASTISDSSTGNIILTSLTGPLAISGTVTTGGDILLDSAGAVTDGTNDTGVFTASGLDLEGAGPFTLINADNSVGTLAADTTGAITFTDSADLTVGTLKVGTQTDTGIDTNGNALTLTTGGLAVNQAISTDAGAISIDSSSDVIISAPVSSSSNIDITSDNGGISNNSLGTITSSLGSVTLQADTDVTIGNAVSGYDGVMITSSNGGISNDNLGTITSSQGGVTLQADTGVTIGNAVSGYDDVMITSSNGGISNSSLGTITSTLGSVTLQADTSVTISNAVSGYDGVMITSSNGSISSGSLGTITSTLGGVTLQADTGVTISNAVSGYDDVMITSSNDGISNLSLGTIDSTTGNITLDASTGLVDIDAGVGANGSKGGATASINITAGTTLTVESQGGVSDGTTANSTDGLVNLTSGGTMSIGGGIGNNDTQNVTITNGGTLSAQNNATVQSVTVTLDGTGTIETGGDAAGLEMDAANLVLNEGSSTGPIWVNNSGSSLNVTGTVATDFALTTGSGDGIVIGDSGLTSSEDNLSGNLIYLQTGSNGTITQTATSTGIAFTNGNGELVLNAPGSDGLVGVLTAHADGLASSTALTTSGVAELAGSANAGFYLNNTSTGLLNVTSIDPSFTGLATLDGVTAGTGTPTGGIEINTGGGLTVTGPVTATNQYVQLVGNYVYGAVTINGQVSAGTAGTGTLTIIGSPTINTTPTVGNAQGNVYISDQDPNGALVTQLGTAADPFNGNLLFQGSDDYRVMAGIYDENGTVTIEADSNDNGHGGVVFLTTTEGNDSAVSGFVNVENGTLDILSSELRHNYTNGTVLNIGGNSYTIVGGTTYGSLTGNGIVFATDAADTTPDITMRGNDADTGTVDLLIKEGVGSITTQNLSVVQVGTAVTITGSIPSTLQFDGDGDVGQSYSAEDTPDGTTPNPLVTSVSNLIINKTATANEDVYLDNNGGINLSAASTLNKLVLDAGVTTPGNVTQGTGDVLTANYLDVTDLNGSIDLNNALNQVAEIDLGDTSGSFEYDGSVNLTVGGPITASADVGINLGTQDFTQDLGAPIDGQTIELTIGTGSQGDLIGSASTSSITISNAGLYTQSNTTPALLEASTLTLNDQSTQLGGDDDVGVSGGPILTKVSFLNFNREKFVSNMFLDDSIGVNIGNVVAKSQGNLTLNITGTGNVIEGGPILLDNTLSADLPATLSVTTANGYVDLSTQPSNEIDAFGTITVQDAIPASGYFLYNGVSGGNPTVQTNALQLLDPINATGNISINVGSTHNILQTAGAPINAPGEVATSNDAGSITFSFDNGTFNADIGNLTAAINNNTPQANIGPDYYTNSDAVAFYNYGVLTLNPGANVYARDSVTEWDKDFGDALVYLGSNITTDGAAGGTPAADITFQSAVTLINVAGAANAVNLTADLANATDGSITFDQTLNGSATDDQDLTAEARNGNITFTGDVGGSVAPGDIVASTDGTVYFGTEASAALAPITVEANSITTLGSVLVAGDTLPDVPVTTVTNGTTDIYADSITTDGWNTAITGIAGITSITGGQVYGNAATLEEANTTLTANDGPSTPSTGTPNNNIYFLSTLDGSVADGNNLTLSPGTDTDYIGNVAFVGAVGGNVRLGNIVVTDAQNLDVNTTDDVGAAGDDSLVLAGLTGSGGLTAATFTQDDGTVTGNTTFGNGSTVETGVYPGEGAIDLNGSTGVGNTLPTLAHYTGTPPTVDALYIKGNNVTFNAGASVNTTGGGTNGNGGVIIDNAGLLTMAQGADMGFDADALTPNTPGLAGQFLQIGGGSVTMGNNITTQGDEVYFNSAVTFAAVTSTVTNSTPPPAYLDSSLINTTGSGNGNGADITFNSSLNGKVSGTNNVTLNAGGTGPGLGGDINFYGPAGTTTELGDLVIYNANNVSLNGNNIAAVDFYQYQGQGTTTVNGTITTSGAAPNETDVPYAVTTPTSAGSYIVLPGGGGVQMNTQYIVVSKNTTADNGGVISLVANGTPSEPVVPDSPPNTYDALLIEDGAKVDANGGGNIVLTTTSTTGADIDIANGSQVYTSGAGSGSITINSSDDVVLDGLGGTTEGEIETVNGNISITADNDLIDSPDNANGVLIEAGNDREGVLVDANGTLTITSTLTNAATPVANNGELVILGGSVTGAFANVESTGVQTVTVAGGPATTTPLTGADPTGVYISGGTGSGSYAALQTTTANGTQSITADTGDVSVVGGAGLNSYARIQSDALNNGLIDAQEITVSDGNLNVIGGSGLLGADAYITSVNTGANEQDVNVSGMITVEGGTGLGADAYITGSGDNTAAGLAQDIEADSATPYSITVEGGSGAGSTAAINATGADSTQDVYAQSGIDIVGGSGGFAIGSTATIRDSGTQSIQQVTAKTGNITLQGGAGSAGDSASIVANGSNQYVDVVDGNLSLTGGLTAVSGGDTAYIQTTSAAAIQDIDVLGAGAGNITVTGGSGLDNEAIIESSDIQNIGNDGHGYIAGNVTLQGGGAGTGNYAAITSVAAQTINLDGNLEVYGSQANPTLTPGANNNDYALIQTNANQTIDVVGTMAVNAFQGRSSGAFGEPLATAGLGAAVIDTDISAGSYTQLITVQGADLNETSPTGAALSVIGGSAGIGNTGAEIEQAGTTSDQQINVTAGSIWVQGGTDVNAYALINSNDTQEIGDSAPVALNVTVQGGGEGTNTGAYAAITSPLGAQQINVAGNLDVYGSDNLTTPETSADNDDYGLIYSGYTQEIDVTGGIVIDAFQGDSSGFHGDFDSIGAVIIADNNQTITALDDGISIQGGTLAGSAAGIDETAENNSSATQDIRAFGTTSNNYSISLQGGTAGNGDEALIYSGNTGSSSNTVTQLIYGEDGILIAGNGASSGDGSIDQPFGNFDSIGAGIVATNSQRVVSGDGLTVEGGSVAGSAAVIYEAANTDTAATQTIDVYGSTYTDGSYGIILQGGTAGSGDEAMIYSANTAGTSVAQSVEAFDSGIYIYGNGATAPSNFDVTTSEGPTTYEVGAGILANNTQRVVVHGTGDLDLQGGSDTTDNAISSAVIGMLNETATQTVLVNDGNLNIIAGDNSDGDLLGSAAGIVSYGVNGSDFNPLSTGGIGAAQFIQVEGNTTLTASQQAGVGTEGYRDAFIDLFADQTSDYTATSATQWINVGDSTHDGYLSLEGGAGGGGDWAYVSSSATQTIFIEGGAPVAGNPFYGVTSSLGLGLQAGSGNYDYAIVHSDLDQTITAQTGDVQVLAGNPGIDQGNDLAAIFTTDVDGGTQTISVEGGNLVVNGESTGLDVDNYIDGDSDYFVGAALVGSSGAQLITVDGTPTADGNITVTGGSGTGGAANIESLSTQTIGTSTGTPNPIAGTITVQGGGTGYGAYAAITSAETQSINVTGNLLVLGSTTATGDYNDDYAVVGTLEDQTITVGGDMQVLAQAGSSDSDSNTEITPGPLGEPGVPTGIGALVIAVNEQGGAGSQDITVNGGDLLVKGGSNGIGQTAAGIEQYGASSDQQILVTDGNVIVKGGTDANGYAQIDSQGTQEIGTAGTPISGNIIVKGGGTQSDSGAYAAITSSSNQTIDVAGGLKVLGSTSPTTDNTGNDQDDFGLIYGMTTQNITVGDGLTVNANYASSIGLGITTSEGRGYLLGAGIAANDQQTITVTTGDANITGGAADQSAAAIVMLNVNGTSTQSVSVEDGNLTLTAGSGSSQAAAGILSYGIDSGSVNAITGAGAAQSITVLGGNLTLTADQSASSDSSSNDAFVDLFADETSDYTANSATQWVSVGQSDPTPGYISLQGGGLNTDNDWAYLSSSATQTIFAEGGAPVAGNPFYGVTSSLGLGLQAGSGNYGYAIVHSDLDQTITAQTGDVQVLAGNPGIDQGNDLAAIFTTDVDGGTQTISVEGGNLVVNGESTGLDVDNYIDGDSDYFVGAALVGSSGAQLITVDIPPDGTPMTAGNITVTGGSGTGGAANIESLSTQTIGTSTGTPNPIAGTITVQGGGTGYGAYAAITSAETQNINVAGNLLVLGSTTATGDYNDDYAIVGTLEDQTITVGGDLQVLAQSGSSDAANNEGLTPGPLGEPGVPTGIGALVIAVNEQGGAGSQDITVNGGDLSVEGGSNGIGQTAAGIEQYGATSDQQILVTDGNVLVEGGTDANGYAQIDSQGTQEIGLSGTPISGTVTVQGGGGAANGGAYAAITSSSNQTFSVSGDVDVTGATSNTNSGNDDYALIQSDSTQSITTISGNVNVTANSGSSVGTGGAGPLATDGLSGIGAAIIGNTSQNITATSGEINLSGSTTTTTNNEALITAVDTYLTMGGSGPTEVSTWTGNSVVGTDGVTQYVELSNSGDISIVTPPVGQINVYADEDTGEIEFNGTGSVTVGSTGDRLGTEANLMQFDDGSEDVYADQYNIPVGLQGTVGTLDLITTGTAAGTDAVTNGTNGLTGSLTANFVTITTGDGGINLDNPDNDVTAFGLINAQGAGSEFNYRGDASVELTADVSAGADIAIHVGSSHDIILDGDDATIVVTAGTPGTSTSGIYFGSTLTSGLPADSHAAGDGSNSLTIAGGDAHFYRGAGTIAAPLENLTLELGTSGDFYPDVTPTSPGAGTLAAPALVLDGSLINENVNADSGGVLTIHDTADTGTTLVVDNGSVGPGGGVFDGGYMDITNAGNVTFYVPTPSSLTATLEAGSAPLPGSQVFAAWTGDPNTLLRPYALNTIFYKISAAIPFPEMTTFDLSNVSAGLYPGYQLGGDDNNSGGEGNNPGGGFNQITDNGGGEGYGSQNPGTLAGTQQYPFISVVDVAGYGPGSDDNGGEVWIGSAPGYLTLGSSDELRAGANAYLFPPDEKHFPKKLKHKPLEGAAPQVKSSGSGY